MTMGLIGGCVHDAQEQREDLIRQRAQLRRRRAQTLATTQHSEHLQLMLEEAFFLCYAVNCLRIVRHTHPTVCPCSPRRRCCSFAVDSDGRKYLLASDGGV